MIIKHLLAHKKYSVVISVVYTLVLTYLCLDTPSAKINFVSQSDKFYHALAYFIYTVLWFTAFRFSFNVTYKSSIIYAFFCALIYGVLIEFLQHFFTINRQGDFKDVIANILGTFFAVILINYIHKKTVKS